MVWVLFAADNATDNQAGVDYSNFWVPGDWQVAAKAGDEWNRTNTPLQLFL